MKPQRMPCVIENVSGMSTSVTNAGRPSSITEKSTVVTVWNIATPTSMRTGAVAYAGTAARQRRDEQARDEAQGRDDRRQSRARARADARDALDVRGARRTARQARAERCERIHDE